MGTALHSMTASCHLPGNTLFKNMQLNSLRIYCGPSGGSCLMNVFGI